MSNAPNVDTWYLPPALQGQMIETWYGIDDEGDLWARDVDTTLHCDDGHYRHLGHSTDERNTDWQPWDRVPAIDR